MPAVAVAPAHRRHDISDRVWEISGTRSSSRGGKGKTGRPAQDNRRFINAVFWILRTGAPWRDLPPDYGDWKNTSTAASAAGGTGTSGPGCWQGGDG